MMPIQIANGLMVCLIALLLSACSGDPDSDGLADETSFGRAPVSQRVDDPCAIVLTPYVDGNAATEGGDIDKKIARYQRAVLKTTHPVVQLERLGWAYINKARISVDPGFYKLAEQSAQCIESKQPNSAEALLLRGHVKHNLHKFKDAERLARDLVTQRGLWFDYALLGDVLMEQGALDEAIEAYQRMVDQRPGPQAYSRVAHIRWLRGDLAGAIEMMQMAVRATSTRDVEAAAWTQIRLAMYLLQIGDIRSAENSIDRALALQPNYAPALLARGRILLAEDRSNEAIAPLTRATELNPLPEYQWVLIEALRAVGQTEGVSDVETQLAKRGAIEDRRSYALYLATIGSDLDTALRLALQELEVREDVFTLDTVAWALSAMGRSQDALVYMDRALAEGTQDAQLFYHAGVIAAKAGDREQAMRRLTQATALQHMLLPSERAHLSKEFAALELQIPNLVSSHSVRRGHLVN